MTFGTEGKQTVLERLGRDFGGAENGAGNGGGDELSEELEVDWASAKIFNGQFLSRSLKIDLLHDIKHDLSHISDFNGSQNNASLRKLLDLSLNNSPIGVSIGISITDITCMIFRAVARGICD